jgi:hypothetical protein
MNKEIQEIIIARREALEDLLKAVHGVLDYMNIYKKMDGTEEEFNVLRVIYTNVKNVK